MTGEQHYRQAEQLAQRSLDGEGPGYDDEAFRARLAAVAQVHATLALAAAAASSIDPAGSSTTQATGGGPS